MSCSVFFLILTLSSCCLSSRLATVEPFKNKIVDHTSADQGKIHISWGCCYSFCEFYIFHFFLLSWSVSLGPFLQSWRPVLWKFVTKFTIYQKINLWLQWTSNYVFLLKIGTFSLKLVTFTWEICYWMPY